MDSDLTVDPCANLQARPANQPDFAQGLGGGTLFQVAAKRFARRIASLMLSPDGRAVQRDRLTYLSPPKLRRLESCIAQMDDVSGCFVEFGVALGGSAILIAKGARRLGRSFHGFDVFGMIPAPTSAFDDPKSNKRYAKIRSGRSKGIDGDLYYGYRSDLLSDVKLAFQRHAIPVDGQDVQFHKGLFEETAPRVSFGAIAFVHIDCDWHDPVAYCLGVVADKMSLGGVILIDDYHDYGGCRAAVDAFLKARHDFKFEGGPNPILRHIAVDAPSAPAAA